MADNLFKCVQRSWETLSDPQKRQQADSVDPTFSEMIPKENALVTFLYLWPVFERNARFSIKQPVPLLGDVNVIGLKLKHFMTFGESLSHGGDLNGWMMMRLRGRMEQGRRERTSDGWRRRTRQRDRKERPRIMHVSTSWWSRHTRQIPGFSHTRWQTRQPKMPRLRGVEAERLAREQEAQREQMRREEAEVAAEQAAKEAAEIAKANKEAVKNALRKERKAFREYWTQVNYHILTRMSRHWNNDP